MQQREDDLRLVAQVVDGEANAHRRLEERIGPVVRGCLGRSLRGPLLAMHQEDLMQSFSLFLLERDARVLRTYRGDAAVSTWIRAVATRYFRAEVRKLNKGARVHDSLDEVELPPNHDQATPEELGTRHRQVEGVRRVVADLDDEDRLLLALTYVDEAPSRVIGRVMGLSATGVRMRKKRLLERLARRLEDLWE